MSSIEERPKNRNIVQLDWLDVDGQVVISPSDGDRYGLKVRRAIELLQKTQYRDDFEKQLQILNKLLFQWLSTRWDDIDKAFMTVRDGDLAFIVVTQNDEYNEQFEDDLSELDIQIANDVDLNLINLTSISLPSVSAEALDSFLHKEIRLSFGNGDRTGPHHAGE